MCASRSQLAAHLEPEILVVDEVLAVGDAAFQKKRLGMMSDVATRNRFCFITAQQHIIIPRPMAFLVK
jgi:lipopolysaccharide transport system ATP-binding protein